jgi:DNA polymerase-1
MYVSTKQQWNECVHAMSQSTRLVMDTETTGLDPHTLNILLFQVKTDHGVFVVDYTKLDPALLKQAIPIFIDSKKQKIFHNAAFDLKVLYKYTKTMLVNVYDTMIVERLLFAGLNMPADLESVAHRRLGIKLNKEIRESFLYHTGEFSQEQLDYAEHDVTFLEAIVDQQQSEIVEKKLTRLVYDIELPLIPVIALMEYTGLPFDAKVLHDLEPQVLHLITVAEKACQDMFIGAGVCDTIVFSKDGYKAVNLNSNAGEGSVKNYLAKLGINIEGLGAKIVAKYDLDHRRKKYDLDLTDLIGDEDNETIDAITLYGSLENPYLKVLTFYKGVAKLYSTYILGLQEQQNPVTKRIHPNFNQVGTKTGRLSSTKPNGQNMPTGIKMQSLRINGSVRESICTYKNVLIIADYSAIELVIIADKSGDIVLMREVDPVAGDVHTMVAREILGVKDITVENKKNKPYSIWRNGSKRLSYSKAYGVHGASLAQQLTVDLASLGVKYTAQDGIRMIKAWDDLFPQAGKWLAQNYNHAISEGYVRDDYGRMRFWDRSFATRAKLGAIGREGSNYPVQSTSANMTKLAMIEMYRRLDYSKARLILQVHDELVIESTKPYADTAAQIMKDSMEYGAKQTLTHLAHYVIVEPSISMKYDK